MDNQQQASRPPSDRPSFFEIPPQMGFWRHLGAHFWGGALFGMGIGLLLAAVLVEQELLTLQHKAWVSVTGILLALTGQGIVRRAVSRDRQLKEDKPASEVQT
jgi:hypothetical protein